MSSAQEQKPKMAGVLGFFEDPNVLIEAMRKVREARYQDFDAFTPYPVHGLDEAQGLKRSPLPFITFFAGLTGFACAFGLQYWTSVVDWPIIVGGKPFNSWPAFVPVMFELTILFAGLSTVAGMFIFNRLPNITQKSFDPSITRDRFAILIGMPHGSDEFTGAFKRFDENEAKSFLKNVGAKEVRTVFNEGWF